MQKNFEIDNSIAIKNVNYYYDLHNCYDLIGLELNWRIKHLVIRFNKVQGEWIKADDPHVIEMHFNDVSYLEISNGFFLKSKYSIDEIGFKKPGDRNYDWLLREDQSDLNDHLFLRMEGNEYLRVFSELIRIIEVKPAPLKHL